MKSSNSSYGCGNCFFKCLKKGDWNRHLQTKKHLTEMNEIDTLIQPLKFNCICGKKYVQKSGLWKHKKTCSKVIEQKECPINDDLCKIIKQNEDFKMMMIEQNKKMFDLAKTMSKAKPNVTITNNFNLNIFLNEKCKDAISITDFINSLQLQLSDLENTSKLGFIESMANIFLNGLKELDIYKRPIHCSDLKREIMYVKDQNNWKKDEEKEKLKYALTQIKQKNIKQLNLWIKQNPDYNNTSTKTNTEYLKLINNSIGGANNDNDKNMNKIIKRIAKNVIINK